MLWKCSVCGMVIEGDAPPDFCPKCGAPKEMFTALSKDEADKIYLSDRTNDIHAEIIKLAGKIIQLTKEGIEINLDPPCVELFNKAKNEAWIIKGRSKAEIAIHISKGKW
jgi:rubredoxin